MPNAPHRSHVSTSTKVAIGVIVIVAIAGFLYYKPNALSSIGLGSLQNLGGGLSDVLGSNPNGARLNFTMSSSESVFSGVLGLDNASVAIQGKQAAVTSVGDSNFDSGGNVSSIVFLNIKGTATLSNGTLSVQGTASSAMVNGVEIKPKSGSFAVSAQMFPDYYSLYMVQIPTISLTNVQGVMQKLGDESNAITLSNSTIQITDFRGEIDGGSTPGSSITGSATGIKGKSFTLNG